MRRLFCIGLTGGIGSGKSTVAEMFAALGVPIIDTDVIARELTQAGGAAMPAIRKEFGDTVVEPSGAMDRLQMRLCALSDTMARSRLEAILHPMIQAEAKRRLEALSGADYAILVVPLLVELGTYRGMVDRVLVVDCEEAMQLARACRRDGRDEAEVRAVMAWQVSRQDRLAQADDVLNNTGDLAALRAAVGELHRKYQKMAGEAVENIA